jgi:hypothetical protein
MLLAWLVLAGQPALADEVLHLGNSYTYFNELDVLVAGLLVEGGDSTATASRLAQGGLKFTDHVAFADTPGSAWYAAMTDPGSSPDWVVLQEQSQIPGFPEHASADKTASIAAAMELDDRVEALGAQTVFLMTWGRRDGDASNDWLYPDYPTMQALLTDGYLGYVADSATAKRPVWVAPAGLAFEAVYEAELAAGDPLAADALFYRLYDVDGSHPSPLGSYLAACVVYATLTGASPEGLSDVGLGLDAGDRDALQSFAAATVLSGAGGIVYPWTVEEPDDTGDTGVVDTEDTEEPPDTEDSGDPVDTEPPDTDAPDTETPADTGPPAAVQDTGVKSGGCGCGAGTPPGGWALLLGALALGRRRAPRAPVSLAPARRAAALFAGPR